ncbi:pentapeptide repeat-containing protein [Nostoc punctiforme UO1]|uniref:pentapeptide repeat-containing protein n=1 Tax=Nostoc punctiforme TaxID=272131 RepID=UPI0030AB7BDD
MALLAAKGKALVVTFMLTIILAGVSAYIGWRALLEDKKYVFIRTLIIDIVARDGTNFRQSNLTDTNFSEAILKNTNFSEANLTRTVWFKAQLLALAKVGNTYLKDKKIRQLLVMGEEQEKNFEREDLRGVNLSGANLSDVSFIGADLSEANLQHVDLSRAKLVQTQLDGTDFTGATLTGAFIEDWNITTDTKFDGVRCEYVYMRLPTPDNPDPHRKPDNRLEVFAPGEFGDFIKPIFDTLDLYHSQGVDPRAIAISFKQLAEIHPEADLRIVGMEVRGEDKFLLRAKTAIAADKSQLSAEYFAIYNQLKALAEQEVKALIAEKDGRIADLQNMVVTALQRPSFYSNVEQVGFMTNNPGGFSVGGSVDGDINNVLGENNQQRVSNKSSSFNLQGAQFAGGLVNADTVNAHQIGGNITNYSPEQKQNLAEAAAEIQQLLNQLGQTYPTATTSQKMSVVAKAVDEIENNPTLKARVIGALKAGGTEAFKELIDHPLVNILLASIDGWQEAE